MLSDDPTLAQSCALAELARRGELTDEHRYPIAELLDEIGTSVRVSAETARQYPEDSAACVAPDLGAGGRRVRPTAGLGVRGR